MNHHLHGIPLTPILHPFPKDFDTVVPPSPPRRACRHRGPSSIGPRGWPAVPAVPDGRALQRPRS
jgi:hypothetical protein